MVDIEFISTFENYYNEESGDKSNTVRLTKDMSFGKLRTLHLATHIRIRKGYTKEFFRRKISNKTFWDGIVIISWRP